MRGEISLPSPPGWHRGLELLENVIYWGKNNPKWIRGSDHGQVSHRKCPRLGLEPLEGLPDHGKGGTESALRSLPTPPILGLCRSRTLPQSQVFISAAVQGSELTTVTLSMPHLPEIIFFSAAGLSLPQIPSQDTKHPLPEVPTAL